MRNNIIQKTPVRQESLILKRLKNVSFLLIGLATILLTLNIIDWAMVFGEKETGLWDHMPDVFRQTILWAYPVLSLTSYVLFLLTKKIKSNPDAVPTILFLFNGFVILLLLGIYVAEQVKKL